MSNASARFMLAHPARWVALGFGSGLSPLAPGTVGTLWPWLPFVVLDRWLDDMGWVLLLGGASRTVLASMTLPVLMAH